MRSESMEQNHNSFDNLKGRFLSVSCQVDLSLSGCPKLGFYLEDGESEEVLLCEGEVVHGFRGTVDLFLFGGGDDVVPLRGGEGFVPGVVDGLEISGVVLHGRI